VPTRVLLAISTDPLRLAYSHSLCQNGVEVTVATGGLDCVAKLRTDEPDILVMESGLPWGGASGVLALMHEGDHLPRVPVLLLCHPTDTEDRDRLVALPSSASFLPTPPAPLLALSIRQHLAGVRYVPDQEGASC
jgi:DNA-binding response OmpR family regulator